MPLSMPARDALMRLLDRDEFTEPDDYVIINRSGRRIDGSAPRRRYKQACEQAKLRPVKLHGLRQKVPPVVAQIREGADSR